jgi:hypothetical protein
MTDWLLMYQLNPFGALQQSKGQAIRAGADFSRGGSQS